MGTNLKLFSRPFLPMCTRKFHRTGFIRGKEVIPFRKDSSCNAELENIGSKTLLDKVLPLCAPHTMRRKLKMLTRN